MHQSSPSNIEYVAEESQLSVLIMCCLGLLLEQVETDAWTKEFLAVGTSQKQEQPRDIMMPVQLIGVASNAQLQARDLTPTMTCFQKYDEYKELLSEVDTVPVASYKPLLPCMR
jgi:hypothetical protein